MHSFSGLSGLGAGLRAGAPAILRPYSSMPGLHPHRFAMQKRRQMRRRQGGMQSGGQQDGGQWNEEESEDTASTTIPAPAVATLPAPVATPMWQNPAVMIGGVALVGVIAYLYMWKK